MRHMKSLKTSQVSIYMALGILVLAVFGLMMLAASGIRPKAHAEKAWDATGLYMQQCMEAEADSILKELGMTGGRLERELMFTSYLIRNGSSRLPTLDEIAQKISEYLNDSLERCAHSYSLPANLTGSEPEFSVLFGLRQTIITISSPYSVEDSGSVHTPSSMVISRDVRFRTMHEAVSRQIEDRLGTGYIADSEGLSVEGHVIEVLDLGSEELWAITDTESYINNEPYRFMFAFYVER